MAVLPSAHAGSPQSTLRTPRLLALAGLVAAAALTIGGWQALRPAIEAHDAQPAVTRYVAEIGGAVTSAPAQPEASESLNDLLSKLTPLLLQPRQPAVVVLPAEPRDTAAQQPAPVVAEVQTPAVVSSAPSAPAAAQAPSAPAAAPAAAVTPAQRWQARGILLEGSETWDAASLANVDAALSSLPTGILSSLGNPSLGPIHILVNSAGRTLSGSQPYGGAANFFSTNDGVNELILYPDQSVYTITHELGHAYNLRSIPAGRYAMVLLDPQMQSFLAATGWHVLSSDAEVGAAVDQMRVSYAYDGGFMWPRLSHNDPLEDFANSFASFFLDPSGLQAQSPARYQWFATNLGQ